MLDYLLFVTCLVFRSRNASQVLSTIYNQQRLKLWSYNFGITIITMNIRLMKLYTILLFLIDSTVFIEFFVLLLVFLIITINILVYICFTH